MNKEISLKLREIVDKAKREGKSRELKVALYALMSAIGIIVVGLSPLTLLENIVSDHRKWNLGLVIIFDIIVIILLKKAHNRLDELENFVPEERIRAALTLADYIDKGEEFKFVGDLDKNFAIEIRRSDNVKFDVNDELIEDSGLIVGKYVNQYGLERPLSLNIDEVIDYEDADVIVNEFIGIKVRKGEIIAGHDYSAISLFQDRQI